MKHFPTLACLGLLFLSAAESRADVAYSLRLGPGYEACNPNEGNASALAFRCCVSGANVLKLKTVGDLSSVLLHSDNCPFPEMMNIELTLQRVASNGTHVYEMTRPVLESTPLATASTKPVQFWFSFHPTFDLDLRPYESSEFFPLIQARMALEDHLWTNGPSNQLYSAEIRTDAGWRKIAQTLVSESQFTDGCPMPMHGICTYERKVYEQVWRNTESGATKNKTVETVDQISGPAAFGSIPRDSTGTTRMRSP